jgi:hypothetical protein
MLADGALPSYFRSRGVRGARATSRPSIHAALSSAEALAEDCERELLLLLLLLLRTTWPENCN